MGNRQVVPPPHGTGFDSIVPLDDIPDKSVPRRISTAPSSSAMEVEIERPASAPKPTIRTPSKPPGPKPSFDFRLTEGQSRRNAMADSERECSRILDFLYVAGHRVAESRDKVVEQDITRVVNCSAAIVPSYFEHVEGMTYLTLNMVDGRQDDICWFLPQVVAFIEEGRVHGEKTLIHCEKGISRSCSFAIAYLMWSAGHDWRQAFDIVKKQRPVCSPNTGFTCNLIEIGDLLDGDASTKNKIFRLAFHLPHDPNTPVFKLCRDDSTRRVATPHRSLLDTRGVFVVLAGAERGGVNYDDDDDADSVSSMGDEDGPSHKRHLGDQAYLWCGLQVQQESYDAAVRLAPLLRGLFTCAEGEFVNEGSEPASFWTLFERGRRAPMGYSDLYDSRGAPTALPDATTHPTYGGVSSRVALGSGPGAGSGRASPPISVRVPAANARKEREVSASKFDGLPPLHPTMGMSNTMGRMNSMGLGLGGSSNSSSTSNAKESLNLKVSMALESSHREYTPSLRERHPEAVDIMRGPTPVEDLDATKQPQRPQDILPPAVGPGRSRDHPPAFFVREASDLSVTQSQQSGTSQDTMGGTTVATHSTVASTSSSMGTGGLAMAIALGKTTRSGHVGGYEEQDVDEEEDDDDEDDEEDVDDDEELDEEDDDDLRGGSSKDGSLGSSKAGSKARRLTSGRPHKPQLYAAEPRPESEGDSLEWTSMGVYDDDDLVEGGCFLLVCPEAPDYLWVGPDFMAEVSELEAVREGFASDEGEEKRLDGVALEYAKAWAATVFRGHVSTDGVTGPELAEGGLVVVTLGSEPESFWNVFSEGF